MIRQQSCRSVGALLPLANDDGRIRSIGEPSEFIERPRLVRSDPLPLTLTTAINTERKRQEDLAIARFETPDQKQLSAVGILIAPFGDTLAPPTMSFGRWRGIIGNWEEYFPVG